MYPIIIALRRLWQELELKDSLGYIDPVPKDKTNF